MIYTIEYLIITFNSNFIHILKQRKKNQGKKITTDRTRFYYFLFEIQNKKLSNQNKK